MSGNMEFILFTFILRRNIFLVELCSIRNDLYTAALFGFSWLRAYNPATEKNMNLINFDLFYSSFIFSQIGKLYKRILYGKEIAGNDRLKETE